MKTTKAKLTTLAGAIAMGFCAIAATFDSIPFNTQTFSEDDPLGVTAITQAKEKVDAVSNKVETVETNFTDFKAGITNTIKGQLTSDATMVLGNAKGEAPGAGVEVGADGGTNYLVFAVNKDIDEMDAKNGDILFAGDAIKFPGTGYIWFGDQTLSTILSNAGQGEVNAINTIKVNGTALVPDGDKAVDITIPSPGDANILERITTNGVEVVLDGKTANLVIPAPGEGNVIETITVNGGSALPVNNKNVDITIPAAGDVNVIETIKTNGVELAVTDKAIDIAIPAPGDANVIESITTNGVALAVNNKVVDITVPPTITALYDIPGAEVAATNAINAITNAQDIATIKQALVDFLNNFKKPTE